MIDVSVVNALDHQKIPPMQISSLKPKSANRLTKRKVLNREADLRPLAIVIHDHCYRGRLLSALTEFNAFRSVSEYESLETMLLEHSGTGGYKCSDGLVVLMDFEAMGERNSKAISDVLEAHPKARVIVLTYSEEEANVLDTIRRGAYGYISKHNDLNKISESTRDVGLGDTVIDPKVACYLARAIRASQAVYSQVEPELTRRQMDVLLLLSEGLQKKEIADRLDLSYHTIAMHTRMIYERFNVNSALAAVMKAVKLGIL